MPSPNARCSRALARSTRNSAGRSNRRGARGGGPVGGGGEGRGGTAVDAESEREVFASVGAVDADLRRPLEPARVAVRGAVEDHHGGAGRGGDAAAARRGARGPEI